LINAKDFSRWNATVASREGEIREGQQLVKRSLPDWCAEKELK
jgi:hypothetical protein